MAGIGLSIVCLVGVLPQNTYILTDDLASNNYPYTCCSTSKGSFLFCSLCGIKLEISCFTLNRASCCILSFSDLHYLFSVYNTNIYCQLVLFGRGGCPNLEALVVKDHYIHLWTLSLLSPHSFHAFLLWGTDHRFSWPHCISVQLTNIKNKINSFMFVFGFQLLREILGCCFLLNSPVFTS